MAWITLLTAAKRLQVTKDTVKYRIKKLPPDMIQRTDGRVYVAEEALALMAAMTQDDPTTPTETQGSPTADQVTPSTDPVTPGHNPVSPDALTAAVAALTAQLEAKDKQIAALNDRLQEVTQALHAAQALHAGTVHRELLEAVETGEQQVTPDDNVPDTQPQKKRGIAAAVRSLFGF